MFQVVKAAKVSACGCCKVPELQWAERGLQGLLRGWEIASGGQRLCG